MMWLPLTAELELGDLKGTRESISSANQVYFSNAYIKIRIVVRAKSAGQQERFLLARKSRGLTKMA